MAHHGQDHWTEDRQLDKQHARARRNVRDILSKRTRRTNKHRLANGEEDDFRQDPQDPWPHGHVRM